MNFSKKLLASAVLLATSSITLAASDTTDITIQITEEATVTLTGSLQANSAPTLSLADVTKAATVLGTLGLLSNVTGTCDIAVTSANAASSGGAFKLENQSLTGTYLHGTGTYNVDIMGTNYGTSNAAGTTDCNTIDANVTLNTPDLALSVPAGTYSDVLTVTVTTPF